MRWISEVDRIIRDKWKTTGKGWKVFLVIGIVILGCIGVVVLALWVVGKIISALGPGKVRNLDLYYPRVPRRR